MDMKERAGKDIEKLDAILADFRKWGFSSRYPKVAEWAENYAHDAKHFFDKGDYFTSFGCANYAYGFVDCIMVLEGRKG